ncbi:uncharacterized protein LOC120838441 [Ixodes scapularis]|uniref:uncharacterized protein LOC120838441 n=1 Tax=Ixodes scapularis TaxID=6945 RepID=UPI001A9D717C|nr:uncharacterized protein LOC120838441 [Ixodes scapularis]
MEIGDLISYGKQLGLKGSALKEWVDSERARGEREKALEREARAEERNSAKEEARAREDAEFRSLELRVKLGEAQIKLREAQNAATPPPAAGGGTEGAGQTLGKNPQRWLPAFNEEKDDQDAYLLRFERLATGQRWPREQWATALSVCLTGEALRVFSRLTPEDSADYDKVKKALLQRFRLTAEGFREKFRDGKPEKGETGTQFAARLASFLDRWVDLSETAKDFDALRNLLLTEQFICGAPPPPPPPPPKLSLFLRKRKSKELGDMAELADRYLEAQQQETHGKGGGADEATRAKQGARPSGSSRPPRRCFLCDKTGHLAADCRAGFSTKKPIACRQCGKTGHAASQCWSRPHEKNKVSCLRETPESRNTTASCVQGGYVELKDGTKVPVLNAVSEPEPPMTNMPVTAGKIQGKTVSVLRDTGCNTVVVRRSLITEADLMGESSPVYLVDGTVRILPEARVHVDTPFFTGDLIAKCMENPLYDVILGNIPNVRAPGDPDQSWNLPKAENAGNPPKGSGEEEEAYPVTAAVETRSNKQKKQTSSPLRVPLIGGEPEKPEKLAEEQRKDNTLRSCFERMGKVWRWRKSGNT